MTKHTERPILSAGKARGIRSKRDATGFRWAVRPVVVAAMPGPR